MQLINSRVLHLMHPCFFSQGPRFIALICLHPWSCEITLGHWTLKLDIGHWNWILKLDIKTGHWTLKMDIQLWQSVILKPKVMLTFIWMHRLLFNNNKDKYLNCYLFCNLLICEGWIYWYNLSPLRGSDSEGVKLDNMWLLFCTIRSILFTSPQKYF